MTTTASSEATPVERTSESQVERVRRSVNVAIVGPIVVFVVVATAWQLGLFHAIFGFKTFTVPYPDGIVAGIEKHGPKLLDALAESMPAAVTGYAAGIASGFAVASMLMLAAPGLANRVLPVLASVNAVPIAALAPLLALWVGPGFQLKVLVIIVMTVPIVVVYTMRGLMAVNPTTLELMASLEASERTVFRTARVPTALPFLFTAMKSCVVLALIGTIVTEVVTGFKGIGFVIVASLSAFQTIQGWLALLAVAGIGITWYLLVELAERVLVPWDAATRRRDA
jgi:NitT/TauT family transport system permease protein